MITEIIVTSLLEAKQAFNCGITRLELIDSFIDGGMSPKNTVIKSVCANVEAQVFVMLRPHKKNSADNNAFIYSQEYFTIIMQQLLFIRDHTNAYGIVFGALDDQRQIDKKLLELVIANKGHLKLTFHRAIDMSMDIIQSYNTLLTYQEVDWVLTSGAHDSCLNGVNNIIKMQNLYLINNNHHNAKLLIGSGINLENLTTIINLLTPTAIHVGQGVRTKNVLNDDKILQLIELIKSKRI